MYVYTKMAWTDETLSPSFMHGIAEQINRKPLDNNFKNKTVVVDAFIENAS